MKKKKILIIIIASIIALLAIIIGFLIKGCREDEPPVSRPNMELIINDPDDVEDKDPSKKEPTLNTVIDNRIGASKYSPIDYSILVPEWEPLPDFYYERLGDNKEFNLNKEWIILDNSNNFNFYSRGFISEDKKAYLFIVEYLGNIKYPMGAQLGFNEHSRATETITHIEKNISLHYKFSDSNSNWTEEELIFKDEKVQKWRFLNGFHVWGEHGLLKSNLLSRGYCLLGYEIPIVVYAFDATEDQIHAETLQTLTENMIDSIIVNEK